MEKFRKGDFIRLKNIELYQLDRYSNINVNIFEISEIESDFVKIKSCKEQIPFSEINSIPINGKDDFDIYYDPIVCASIVAPGEPAPIRKTDYSYYYEAFKRSFYENKNFQELIKDLDLKYVHEVQHFLIDKFQDNGLRINTY